MVMLRGPVRELCQAANLAHVATVLPGGAPHSVPVRIGAEGERVAFFTGPGSRKARNIAGDPRVAISITGLEQPFRMAMIRGRVVGRVEGEAGWDIIDRVPAVYTGGPYPRGEQRIVFLVAPGHMTTTAY
jgi:PPOX class probable F420-dependent enzyme